MQNHRISAVLAGVVVCTVVACLGGQERRASPHETATGAVDGVTISIEYGRPYVKGRQIWGGLNPWGKVWRLGADESTTMTTSGPLQFGTLTVPAGKHSLYMWVDDSQPKLIVNKATGQWGTEYDEKQDLGRVDLVKKTVPKVEQMTIAIAPTALTITWDDREYSTTIKK